MTSVFFDTWAYVALADVRDAGHEAAIAAFNWVRETKQTLVTSDYIIDEVITSLHAATHLQIVSRFIDMLEARVATRELALMPITAARRAVALRWFRRLAPDTPRLSFTDCTSFALLEELQIDAAFTPDRHFSKVKGVHRLIHLVHDRLVFRAPVGY